uniref:CRAL-TRIO domain-containing protein n=1 Tax=Lutzomyia longipalpis TaxID=7200 RepID=A0A1B0CNW3_LUTLO
MMGEGQPVNPEDLKALKERMQLIAEADPTQYHNEFSLRRYLRAFKTVDAAFQAILKTNKWRENYGVKDLEQQPAIQNNLLKARVLNHRDITGRPVIYIPAKNHNSSERDIDELTKFIVYCLVRVLNPKCPLLSFPVRHTPFVMSCGWAEYDFHPFDHTFSQEWEFNKESQ